MRIRIQLLVYLLICLPLVAKALPNPAAVYCKKKGYRYLIVKNVGVCLFPDFSYCEEWAYFRGQCKPKTSKLLDTKVHLQRNYDEK